MGPKNRECKWGDLILIGLTSPNFRPYNKPGNLRENKQKNKNKKSEKDNRIQKRIQNKILKFIYSTVNILLKWPNINKIATESI